MTTPSNVIDVLGRSRLVRDTYPDGSFTCPFCDAAVIAPAERCENPGCSASTYAIANPACAETFREKIAAEERRQAEEAERRLNHERAMTRITEDNARHEAWRQEQIAEANRRGACLRCLFAPGWERVKFIRHRGGVCPKALR